MCIRDRDHIARCIESIRRQTYRNLEIILLNDGSKDVSYEMCIRDSYLPVSVCGTGTFDIHAAFLASYPAGLRY